MFTFCGPLINKVTLPILIIPESGNFVSCKAIIDTFLFEIELTKSWIAPVLKSVLTFHVAMLIYLPIRFFALLPILLPLSLLLSFGHRVLSLGSRHTAGESERSPLLSVVGSILLFPIRQVRFILIVVAVTMEFLHGRSVNPRRTTSVTERIGTRVLAGYKGWSSRLGWPYQE